LASAIYSIFLISINQSLRNYCKASAQYAYGVLSFYVAAGFHDRCSDGKDSNVYYYIPHQNKLKINQIQYKSKHKFCVQDPMIVSEDLGRKDRRKGKRKRKSND